MRIALALLAAAVLAAPAGAAIRPHLRPSQVKAIAIRAARPYEAAPTDPSAPAPKLTVDSVRRYVWRKRKLIWRVTVRTSDVFLFQDPPPVPDSIGPLPDLTPLALVSIDDRTARVLGVAPVG